MLIEGSETGVRVRRGGGAAADGAPNPSRAAAHARRRASSRAARALLRALDAGDLLRAVPTAAATGLPWRLRCMPGAMLRFGSDGEGQDDLQCPSTTLALPWH